MEESRVIRNVELEDQASPRSARYAIRLRQLAEGYVVETVWGGALDRKHFESYFRPTLVAAQEKFERILTAKTSRCRSSRRRYRLSGDGEQLVLTGVMA